MVSTAPEKQKTLLHKGLLPAGLATCVLWAYFLGIGCLFCLFGYLPARLFAHDREKSFQRLNTIFFKGFFFLVRSLFPMHTWNIDPEIKIVRSSVIVCNHLSYLDPLIMIAQFCRQKTIVKSKFFTYPVFGWLLKHSGYLPSNTGSKLSGIMIDQINDMPHFLADGGNLFIFPEGTRSQSGELGTFNPGAFKIARLSKAPIVVMKIKGSEKLFTPGSFAFNTSTCNTITVTIAGHILPDYETDPPTATELKRRVLAFFSR